MRKSVFEFIDYKEYVSQRLERLAEGQRGAKSRLSQTINCQLPYLSQVLNGDAHFSLEQAEGVNRHFGHTKEEAHYFILLVLQARSGTDSLRNYFGEQLQKVIEGRLELKNRLDVKEALSLEDKSVYYSAWYYTAIHIMTSVPEFQTKKAIALSLNLPLSIVAEVLDFLYSVGLVASESEHYKINTTRIHLGSDSPLISKHHTNWRMKAIQSLDRRQSADLHYSSVISISKKDALRMKSHLVNYIEELKAITRESNEEEVHCLSLDFFQI